MARRKSRTLTELELEIMHVVWGCEETTVDAIEQTLGKNGRPLAPPSIRTMLGILQEKGYVKRRRDGRGFAYRAVVEAGQAEKSILKDLVDRVFDGSASNLVAALVSQGMVGKDDLAEARKLIAKRERGRSGKSDGSDGTERSDRAENQS